jgi:hypothetical protein
MYDADILRFIRALDETVPRESAEECAFDETHSEADLNYLFSRCSDFGIEHLARTREELELFSG